MGAMWQTQGQAGPGSVAFLTLFFAAGIIGLALWVALPFAVFEAKAALRELLEAQRETNRKLDALRQALESFGRLAQTPSGPSPGPAPDPAPDPAHLPGHPAESGEPREGA